MKVDMYSEAYFMVPFWLAILCLLRCFCGTGTSLAMATALFAAAEMLKGRKSDMNTWQVLTASGSTIIGHRGCSINAPENTIAAVKEAHRLGVKAVEVDVQFSKDGIPVVIHDKTVDRTTDGSGFVSDKTWAELQELNASHGHPKESEFPNERIPRLEDVLTVCKELGLTVYLDLVENDPALMVQAFRDMSLLFPDLHKWSVACSFYPNVLYRIKWHLPQFSAILTHRPWVITYTNSSHTEYRQDTLAYPMWAPVADVVLELSIYSFWWYISGVNGVFMHVDTVNERQRRFWASRGMKLFAWTINDLETKNYFKHILHVPYITDDCSY